jgi:hypothetical protein
VRTYTQKWLFRENNTQNCGKDVDMAEPLLFDANRVVDGREASVNNVSVHQDAGMDCIKPFRVKKPPK